MSERWPAIGPAEHAGMATLLDALSTSGTAVLILDAQRTLQATNRAFVTLAKVGIPPAALIGTPMPDGPATFAHMYADPAAVLAGMRSLMHDGRSTGSVLHELTDSRVVDHAYAPITEGGTTTGHVWIMREVQTATAELGSTGPSATGPSATGTSQAHLADPMLAGTLTSTIAHEVRTPATSVAAFAAMLDDTDLDQDGRRRAADAVRRNAERLLLLASDLVLVSDLDSGALQRDDHLVDVGSVLRQASDAVVGHSGVTLLENTLLESPAEMTGGPMTTGNAGMLRTAFVIILCTVEAASDGAGLTVTTTTTPGWWTLSVSGPTEHPVSAETLLSLRVPDERDPEISRTGALALMLARAIIRHHGGACGESGGPEGFTAVMRLPVSAAFQQRASTEHAP